MARKNEKIAGVVQWLPFEERELAETVFRDLEELKIGHFRTILSWADWEREGGRDWFDFFLGEVKRLGVELLPCLCYTPPSLARKDSKGKQKTSYPPRDISAYVGFAGEIIEKYGELFEWVQIWNEPNWTVYWDWDMDPEWKTFADMAEKASDTIHRYGKKAVLGGLTPFEPEWITRMNKYGLMKKIEAIAFHQSPGSWQDRRKWFGWETELENARALLRGHGLKSQVWITETGYSTFGNEEEREERYKKQIEYFHRARSLEVPRIYWYSVIDQKHDTPTDDDINIEADPDETAYHFGWRKENFEPKPLHDYFEKEAQKGKEFPYL